MPARLLMLLVACGCTGPAILPQGPWSALLDADPDAVSDRALRVHAECLELRLQRHHLAEGIVFKAIWDDPSADQPSTLLVLEDPSVASGWRVT